MATNFLRIALSDSKRLLLGAGSQLVSKLIHLPGGARSLIRDLSGPILGHYDDDLETTDATTTRLRKEAIDLVIEILLLCPPTEVNFHEIIDLVIVPGMRDSKQVVRSAAVDCLAVAASLEGEALIDCVELQLSALNQNNNSSHKEELKGNKSQEEQALLQIIASLRSAVLQRQLPTLDPQSRLVRPARRNSNNGMSGMGHTSYEASSSAIGERRKPSAGRMHGNLRLPWDPRDSVVIIGSGSGSSGGSPFSQPSPNAPVSADADLYGSGSNDRLSRRSNANQLPLNRSLELNDQVDVRRSLNLSTDFYHRANQAITPPMRTSYAGMQSGSMKEFSASLSNLSAASGGNTNQNLKVTSVDSPELYRDADVDDSMLFSVSFVPAFALIFSLSLIFVNKSQHEIAKNMMLPCPEPDFDVVGRSVHPVASGICSQSIEQETNENNGSTDCNGISSRTTVLEKLLFETNDVKEDEEDGLKIGFEGHTPRSFSRRSSRALQGENSRSGSLQRKRRGEVDGGALARTSIRTSSSQRPSYSRSRKPPTGPREGSLSRRSTRQQSPDNGGGETAFSRLSRNSSANAESGLCRDVSTALNHIASSEWEDKVDGLLSLSTLALRNPNAFANTSDAYSAVIHAVISECKNLRSQNYPPSVGMLVHNVKVSRQAVKTLSDLFRGLGRLLDPYVDTCVRVLLGKTGEASAAFLRGEVAVALSDLIRSVNPNRALIALFQHGLGHKNAAVRRQCAIQASYLIESLGANRVLQAGTSQRSGGGLSSWSSMTTVYGANSNTSSITAVTSASSQAITERVLVALGKFLLDSNQETRYYGRRILVTLQHYPDFERLMTRYLSGQMLRAVREATDYLHTKGLGEPPASAVSASCPRTAIANDLMDPPTQHRGCSAGGLGGL
ncbi:hypothetical protein Aperf_G00000081249 [Anoplocephala perfoliata]